MKLWICVVFLFCTHLPCIAETLQEKAESYHANRLYPTSGVSMAEINEGGEPEFGSAGLLRNDGPAVSSETLFEIGSITKTFTGILLADAAISEKASLTDTVATWLPDLELKEDSPLQKITLLELATHTSGLPRIPGDLDTGAKRKDPYAHYDAERLHQYLETLEDDDLKNRGKVSYSNLGVGLLGHLLEKIYARPYEAILSEKILTPLGMKQTFFQRDRKSIPESSKPNFATGHFQNTATSHWHIDALGGAGAIVSSAEDLANYAEAHWSNDIPEDLRAAINLATEEHADGIGLGWFVSKNGLAHSGGTGGFRSDLRINPKTQGARIRLINNSAEKTITSSKGDFSSLEGFWSGTLSTGRKDLRLVFRIAKDGRIVQHSIDQGGNGMDANETSFEGTKLIAGFSQLNGTFTGEKSGTTITGTRKQGRKFPLTLEWSRECPKSLLTILEKKVSNDVSKLDGYWSGYLGGKAGLFLILEVEAIGTTGEARLYSPDQTQEAIPITKLSFQDDELSLESKAVNGTYVAKLDDENKLAGLWNQGVPIPLTLIHSETKPERE